MMLRKDVSDIQFQSFQQDIIVPDKCNYIDYTIEPFNEVGCKGGAATVLQYINSIDHRLQKDEFKDYRRLYSTAMNSLNTDESRCFTFLQLLGIFQTDSEAKCLSSLKDVKIAMHRYGPILLETSYIDVLCNNNIKNIEGNYLLDYSEEIQLLSKNITKSLIAVAYDNVGLLVQNNHGTKYGSLGFVKLSWNLLNSTIDNEPVFIKGIFLKDSLDNIGQI